MGAICHLILQAIEERSNRQIEREILSYKETPYNKDKPIKRKINAFRTRRQVQDRTSILFCGKCSFETTFKAQHIETFETT
jgi:hypothetical protein